MARTVASRADVVVRIWRGWTRASDADAYAGYIRDTGFSEYRATPGNLGALILRRDVDDRTEFVTLSWWRTLADVRAFAGDDVERAVLYPEDERFLVDADTTVTHFTVAAHDVGGLADALLE